TRARPGAGLLRRTLKRHEVSRRSWRMMVIMGRTISANRHYQELDSLRGLAAITVLISHYLYPFLVENGPYVGIALLAFTHALYGTIPVVAILLLASVTSVFIAWLSYEF